MVYKIDKNQKIKTKKNTSSLNHNPKTNQKANTISGIVPIIHRKSVCVCDGVCPSCQADHLLFQSKINLNTSEDKVEQEAEHYSNLLTKSAYGTDLNNIDNINQLLERNFNKSTKNVKMINNNESWNLNSKLNSRAFTFNNETYFGKGEYNLGSKEGQKLYIHEMVHHFQQKSIKNGIFYQKIEGSSNTETNQSSLEKAGLDYLHGQFDRDRLEAELVKEIENFRNLSMDDYKYLTKFIQGLENLFFYFELYFEYPVIDYDDRIQLNAKLDDLRTIYSEIKQDERIRIFELIQKYKSISESDKREEIIRDIYNILNIPEDTTVALKFDIEANEKLLELTILFMKENEQLEKVKLDLISKLDYLKNELSRRKLISDPQSLVFKESVREKVEEQYREKVWGPRITDCMVAAELGMEIIIDIIGITKEEFEKLSKDPSGKELAEKDKPQFEKRLSDLRKDHKTLYVDKIENIYDSTTETVKSFKPSPRAFFLKYINYLGNKSGIYFFGVALHKAHHSVIIMVDNSEPTTPEVFWFDQNVKKLTEMETEEEMTAKFKLYFEGIPVADRVKYKYSEVYQFVPPKEKRKYKEQ